jgi:AraC-like DNA-binding protein
MSPVIFPDPRLSSYVTSYLFVRDLTGEQMGKPIHTCPQPGVVLSVNFGRPNAMIGGPIVPQVSLLGVQTVSRAWRSWENTYFVMAMLTVEGLVRLFPATGESIDQLIDLGSLVGDATTDSLRCRLDAAWTPSRIAAGLDEWLLSRLEMIAAPQEFRRMSAAHRLLRAGLSVEATANAVEVSRRQLSRWYNTHLGAGPKQIMDLERLRRSIQSTQSGRGDPLMGFTDQAHLIRNWRQRLGTTPGAYARTGPSHLAHLFNDPGTREPVFYL